MLQDETGPLEDPISSAQVPDETDGEIVPTQADETVPLDGVTETTTTLVDRLSDPAELANMGMEAWQWLLQNIFTVNMMCQLTLVLAAIIPAIMFGPRLQRLINEQITNRLPYGGFKRATNALATIATPIALYLVVTIFKGIFGASASNLDMVGDSTRIMAAAQSLLAAWIIVRLITLIIRSPFWSKVAFWTVWPVMALNAFGLLDNVIAQMQAASIPITPGDENNPPATLSLFDVLRAAIIFAVFFWIASTFGKFAIGRVNKVDELNPSLKALFAKFLNLALPIIALLLALQVVGFNLASLAIFGGAVGIGIGLGLQKMIANLAAGITLLMDKSIKPGDSLEVDGQFGWVTEMNTRCVAIRTRDGKEHLIPNSIFVDNGVTNWSYGEDRVRMHVPFGVSYGTEDMQKVRDLAAEAAKSVARVLKSPEPVCHMVEFGDSSVNFDLRFWINDPPNGLANVKGAVMLAIWDALKEHNIEIPYPQRDLHIRSSDVNFEK